MVVFSRLFLEQIVWTIQMDFEEVHSDRALYSICYRKHDFPVFRSIFILQHTWTPSWLLLL